MDIRLADKQTIQPGVVTFQWTTPEPVVWQAGQYGVFYLEHPNWDSKGPERKFTISSAPHEPLAFTIKLSNSSFKHALEQLQIGQSINLKNVGGTFTVGPNVTQPLVFIAGGIGITPFRAILADVNKQQASVLAHLLYVNSDENFVFQDQLDALRAQHPEISIKYLIGRKSLAANILTNISGLLDSRIMVSGPTPFLDHVEYQLTQAGVDENTIQYDDFEEDWPA